MVRERAGKRTGLVGVKTLEAVCPEKEVGAAEGVVWIAAIGDAATKGGFDFSLQTEDEIRIQPLLWNAKLLGRYADDLYPDILVRRGREALLSMPAGGTIDAFQDLVGGEVDAFALAIRLDWLGHVQPDRHARVSRHSRLRQIRRPAGRERG
mgnify:CR=1 FL=1